MTTYYRQQQLFDNTRQLELNNNKSDIELQTFTVIQLNGQHLNIKLSPNNQIIDIKLQLSKLLGVEVKLQELYMEGSSQPLIDTDTVDKSNLVEGSTIIMIQHNNNVWKICTTKKHNADVATFIINKQLDIVLEFTHSSNGCIWSNLTTFEAHIYGFIDKNDEYDNVEEFVYKPIGSGFWELQIKNEFICVVHKQPNETILYLTDTGFIVINKNNNTGAIFTIDNGYQICGYNKAIQLIS